MLTEISTFLLAKSTITDIPFMPKMQKRAKHMEVKLPFFNNKSSKYTYYGLVSLAASLALRQNCNFVS